MSQGTEQSWDAVCPYCQRESHFKGKDLGQYETLADGGAGRGFSGRLDNFRVRAGKCSSGSCRRWIVVVTEHAARSPTHVVWPRHVALNPAQEEVPIDVARDYAEAHAVLPWSERAAAALARRAMQAVLRENNYTGKTLYQEIEAAIADPSTPSYLRERFHAVRKIGNIGAHPSNDAAGAIVEVPPDAVPWMLETVYDMFDHYYVKPKKAAEMIAQADLLDDKSKGKA